MKKDNCKLSYTHKHIWRMGEVYRDHFVFGWTWLNFRKLYMKVLVCQACGLMLDLRDKDAVKIFKSFPKL